MKKRIAVFSNAWAQDSLSNSLEGLMESAKRYDTDVFVFLSHAAVGHAQKELKEELRIFDLPDLREFDGVIIFSAMMNFNELVFRLCEEALDAKVPVVSVGIEVEGTVYVGNTNKESMIEMVEHLVNDHNVKDIEFIAGPEDNNDSNERIESVREVFSEHGLEFRESDIYYTDWSSRNAWAAAKDIFVKRKDNLPDAIICANDIIAMAACTEAENRGITVPDDLIVVGYDNLYDAQIFYPSISTVGQDYRQMGAEACNMLMEALGGKCEPVRIVRNQFNPNQSCGCTRVHGSEVRINACKTKFRDHLEDTEFSWSNAAISNVVLSCRGEKEIKSELRSFFKRNHMFPDETVYILEDRIAFRYFANRGSQVVNPVGYSEVLDPIVAIENGEEVQFDNFTKKELIPGYRKKEGKAEMYMFFPVHFDDFPFGYVVVKNWYSGIRSGKIIDFSDRYNHTLDILKQNLVLEVLNNRLTDLYTKDPITNLYNRMGLDSLGNKMYEECIREEKHLAIMFVDINRMKYINDSFGHLQGDLAIKTVADSIRNNINKDWMAIRFGGDEFLILGKTESEGEVIDTQANIAMAVKDAGYSMHLPYYLSVSCGYIHVKPTVDKNLDKFIKQADDAMYEVKTYLYNTDEELKKFIKAV